ncbi:hypothetical protein BGZ96_007483 [Linnemannia gamsii]|uniref:RNI-like protein n=1 Tax=Linnemannia gamsii TaxID=64522 RepID=A0ABQ7K172_9FUNG|nr:hypothetical protein BGZ96_007483 [Linnemannia gamsii]
MVRLGRNRSLPAPPSNGTALRKVNTNVFSFPTLTLTRTLSERSNDGGNNSRSSSMSRSISRTRSRTSAPISLAPIIAAIQRGDFVKLSEMDIEALLEDMAGKSSKVLEALNISSASISASDAKILAKLIKSSDTANIKTLKMEGNAISEQASKMMFEGWKFNRTISTLSLARSGVNDKTVKYLARVIGKNEVLKTLDLSGNHITALGAEYLADAMIQNRSITRLCIQSNNIRKAGAPFIAKILNKNRVVRHLNMGSNGLGADGVSIIAESVRFNRTLTSLSLDMNEMGPKGANAIATALFSNRHLTHLYIPHNNIGCTGLAALCESLKRNWTLISLDLELNHIGKGQSAVGLKALGELLLVSTSIRELNLSFNLFSAEAIAALAAGMCQNSTLESVLLNNCCLPTEAAVSLSKVLSCPCTGLQNLGLTNNAEIGVDGYWELASHLTRNRSLKGIQLDYNSDDRQAIYESFQNSLTRNHIWQQAIYAAACRILFLSRIVLLGRPANQKQLQRQQQHHIQSHQQHSHGWNIFRRVKLGRTNSSNSLASLLTIGKSHHRSNGADGGGQVGDIGTNMTHSNSHARHISTATAASTASTIVVVANSNGSVHGASPSHHHHTLTHRPSISSTTSASVSTAVEYEYNPHKILANLCNMPHEIFESICAFLDPGRTMNIAQIRMTVQTAGDRTTLARYYTRERMLERIFHSRYISPLGTRYSLKHGDERT